MFITPICAAWIFYSVSCCSGKSRLVASWARVLGLEASDNFKMVAPLFETWIVRCLSAYRQVGPKNSALETRWCTFCATSTTWLAIEILIAQQVPTRNCGHVWLRIIRRFPHSIGRWCSVSVWRYNCVPHNRTVFVQQRWHWPEGMVVVDDLVVMMDVGFCRLPSHFWRRIS